MLYQTIILLTLPFASASFLPSFRRAPSCGVKGYIDDDNNYFYSTSRKLSSYTACSARCARDSRCESFGFEADGRVCMLFDETLAGNIQRDRDSDYIFYDAACIEDEPITTHSTTTQRASQTMKVSASRTKSVVQASVTSFANSTGNSSAAASNTTTTVFVIANPTLGASGLVATTQGSGATTVGVSTGSGAAGDSSTATAISPAGTIGTDGASVGGLSFPSLNSTTINSTLNTNSTLSNSTSFNATSTHDASTNNATDILATNL